ncbi:MAG: ABC transporter permease [Actinobacteria bacterium]|nr:ABC transporter permease [Actinomycetota bacterium]
MKTFRKYYINELFYKFGLYIVIALLVAVFSIINPRFFSITNGINILQQMVTIGIASCGLTFVIVTAGIDLSLGSVIYITSVLVTILTNKGLGLVGAIALSIGIGAVLGAINGFFVAKLKIAALIVTLATLYIIRGLGIVIGGTGLIYFSNTVSEILTFTRLLGVIPISIIFLIAVLIITQIILSKTRFGLQLYAIGNNINAAKTMGIKVSRNIFISYIICGALVGLAGLISGAQVGGISSTFAVGQEFIIISATVLGGVSLYGGKGKAFPGAFIGVLIIISIENGLVMAKTDLYFYSIIRGLIIFIAVMLDSINNKGESR